MTPRIDRTYVGRTIHRAVLTAYESAWNKHDMTAWSNLFTDDVDYVN